MNYISGSRPSAVIAGDFNNDNKLDLAVANSSENTVSVLLNDGNESFQPQIKCKAGSYPVSIISDDFNNDNKPDLAVANKYSADVIIFLNKCK
jgi:hypothetical protein